MYLENNQVRRYPFKAILAWSLVVVWMAVIFFFSNQSGSESGSLSRYLAEHLLRLLQRPATESDIVSLETILRSVAHGSIFFVLALLTSWAFTCIEVQDIRNALLALVISALYAVSDELHQMLIPGRAAQVSDFLIDLSGIIAAIIAYQAASTLRFLRSDLRVKREEDLRI